MVKRCGCVGKDCECSIKGGTGVAMTGSGSQANPYVLNISGVASLRGSETATGVTTVTGTGTSVDPYNISIALTQGAAILKATVATWESGAKVWTRGATTSLVYALVIGGGGGGCGGGAALNNYPGQRGVGGAGGGYSARWVQLPASVVSATLTAGKGGSGGLGRTTLDGSTAQREGNQGGTSKIVFYTNTGAIQNVIAATGGKWNQRGGGLNFGQYVKTAQIAALTDMLGYAETYGGGAGGNGEGGTTAEGANYSWRDFGGVHLNYEGQSGGTLYVAGDGGDGGLRELPGQDGWLYGGGGGGGGGGNVPSSNGGNGGNGANGIAVLIEV